MAHEAQNLLRIIIGSEPPETFGQLFADAFAATFGTKACNNSYTAAGIICSLFLSVILQEFPQTKLSTFAHNIKESCTLFAFDCKSYEAIYSAMQVCRTVLLDKECKPVEREIDKKEIFEAFDFITNT